MCPAPSNPLEPTIYCVSDLHIGGDAVLNHCRFTDEFVDFLKRLADGPQPAELIILGDAFGLWELAELPTEQKLPYLFETHGRIFNQLRETGHRVRITLVAGNHDHELITHPACAGQLACYNVHLEPAQHITRHVGRCVIWFEHGNQHDPFNTFTTFGDPAARPPGYFLAGFTVNNAVRMAPRAESLWLGDMPSVYPNEDVPFWIWSNYYYREMAPLLRWLLLPFLALFSLSALYLLGYALEAAGILPTIRFHSLLPGWMGWPLHVVDVIVFINAIILLAMLILAVPLYFIIRDFRRALTRYGLCTSRLLGREKEKAYNAAAANVFREHPEVVAFVYGHTHAASLRRDGGRVIINTGTWLKRLSRIAARFRLLPDVYVGSYRLNYFAFTPDGDALRITYHVVPKAPPCDLTLFQKASILFRRRSIGEPIPAETVIQPP